MIKTSLNFRASLNQLCFVLLTGMGTSLCFAQSQSEIPPPSDIQPERILIPIKKSQDADNDSEDGPTEAEIAAFEMAANAKGWIPEGSSGRLRNGMQVSITVMVQGIIEHASEAQRINHSGKIGLPLLQNVEIGNMDIEDIEEMLTSKYAVYYKAPLVNVEFVGDIADPSQSPWGYVTMMGNVSKQGPLAMPPTQSLTVSGAVKLAEGLASSANKGSIRIFRPHPELNEVEVIKVDLDDLAKKGKGAEDVTLRAGDVVFIPERIF